MAYAGSNYAKINFVGGAVFFSKFGLFFPENCNFAHKFKDITAMRLILVPFTPKWPMLVPIMQIWNLSGVPFLQNFGFFCPENCNFAHNIKGIAAMRLILVPFIPKWPMPVPMMQKWKFSGMPSLRNLVFFCLENCNFAHNFKGIAAMRVILVPITQNGICPFQWCRNQICRGAVFAKFWLFSLKIAFLLIT